MCIKIYVQNPVFFSDCKFFSPSCFSMYVTIHLLEYDFSYRSEDNKQALDYGI